MTRSQSFYQGGTCFQPAVPSFHPPESKTIENQNGVCQAFASDVRKKVNKASTITKLFPNLGIPFGIRQYHEKIFFLSLD